LVFGGWPWRFFGGHIEATVNIEGLGRLDKMQYDVIGSRYQGRFDCALLDFSPHAASALQLPLLVS